MQFRTTSRWALQTKKAERSEAKNAECSEAKNAERSQAKNLSVVKQKAE